MKKILTIIFLSGIINITAFSQVNEKDEVMYQKDSALPLIKTQAKNIKDLDLSKQQRKQLKSYKKASKARKRIIEKNAQLSDDQKIVQLQKLENEKHEKLEAILTPKQKEKLKQTKENKPRRGVTNMPNERTVK